MSGENIFPVIMAGGRGTRFWPASVKARPKQFMELIGQGTMIQITAGRFRNLAAPGNVIVVTGAEHGSTVLKQLPLLDRKNLLLEPVGRNTAACIGWAAETLRRRGSGDAVMVVAASDHLIEPECGFESTVRQAVTLAEQGYLCTIGIPPDHPATGYGYLQKGEEISPGWKVKTFREKPDAATALEYVASEEFLWNSGMFIWKADVFLEELGRYMPDLLKALQNMDDSTSPPAEVYGALESQSIDYGVMEKTRRAVIVPAEFSWSDIGDWPGAKKAGVSSGEKLEMDCSNTMVFDETGRLTVLVGVSDLCVVTTDRVTLVMADEKSQKIKGVVEKLEREKPELT